MTLPEEIDHYLQTIHAMVGFANFYRYDDERREMRPDVAVLQGWRFTPLPALDGSNQSHEAQGASQSEVTPDLAILITTVRLRFQGIALSYMSSRV